MKKYRFESFWWYIWFIMTRDKKNRHSGIAYGMYDSRKAREIVEKHQKIRRIISYQILSIPFNENLRNYLIFFQALLLIATSKNPSKFDINVELKEFWKQTENLSLFLHNWIKINLMEIKKKITEDHAREIAVALILKDREKIKCKTIDNVIENLITINKTKMNLGILFTKEKFIKSALKIGVAYYPIISVRNIIDVFGNSANPLQSLRDWFLYKFYKDKMINNKLIFFSYYFQLKINLKLKGIFLFI